MPPDPPREQGPPGLATPSQINTTPTSKTVENPVGSIMQNPKMLMKSSCILPKKINIKYSKVLKNLP